MHSMTHTDPPRLTLVTATENELPPARTPIEPIWFLQAITATLDVQHAMKTLNQFLGEVIHHSGWEYHWNPRESAFNYADIHLEGGKSDRHSLEYTLIFNDDDMGLLKLMRGRRFSDIEQTHIEALIGLAAPALYHALRFHKLNEQLERDLLTGLGNRRALNTQGAAWLADCERHDRPASMLALDLDKFKLINDRCGHAEGDRVLTAVGAIIRGITRSADLAVRLGGDEFVVLLPTADMSQALECAERIRAAVASLILPTAHKSLLRVSTSIGIATYHPGMTLQELYERADAALYAAKHAGRNQVLTNDAHG